MATKGTDESSAPELNFRSTRLLECSSITTLQTVIYKEYREVSHHQIQGTQVFQVACIWCVVYKILDWNCDFAIRFHVLKRMKLIMMLTLMTRWKRTLL